MADSDLEVTFSGDASGLTSAAGEASAAVRGVGASVGDVQGGLTQFHQALNAAFQPPDVAAITAAAAQALSAVQAAEASLTAVVTANAQTRGKAVDQVAKAAKASWDASVGATTKTFADGLLKMVQGSETFSKVINQTANRIESYFANAGAKILSGWLYTETHKAAISAAATASQAAANQTAAAATRALSFETAQKEAFNAAVSAASKAYNAMAGVPLIGPALGAAAASATFTAVEAYGAMASAAGGYDIPAGVNPIVQTHAQEMILPARIANPMRDMLSDYATSDRGLTASGPSAAAAGGDTHHWHINAMDPRSFETYLRRNSDTLASVLNDKVRGGAKLASA